MVHIRCCYNNKFLRRGTDKVRYIYAVSDEKVEKQDDWTCTLFTPEFVADGTVRFLHEQMKTYAQCSIDTSDPLWMCIVGYSSDPNLAHNFFQVIDWESLVMLPRHVSFKGDNGAYLGLVEETGGGLRFVVRDEADKSIANHVIVLPDGTIRIKNVSLGALWRRDAGSNYIVADELDSSSTLDSLFQAVKRENSTVALCNLGNNMWCRRYTEHGHAPNSFNANESGPSQYDHLELTELVAVRNIGEIKLNPTDGWVHDKISNVILNPGKEVINDTATKKSIRVQIPYFDVKVSTWKATSPTFNNLGPQVEIEPEVMPIVTDSSIIDIVAPFNKSYVWGRTFELKSYMEKVYEVTLEPMTKVTVKLLATLVSCHVPLTYTRYDIVDETTGEEDNETLDDGVYSGTNYINLTVEQSPPQPITN
ncbi:hypothetical protein LINGRAPRIM_LOCUS2978 [Linum grandiflorum]